MQSLPTLTVCTLYAGILVRITAQQITTADMRVHGQYRHIHSLIIQYNTIQ